MFLSLSFFLYIVFICSYTTSRLFKITKVGVQINRLMGAAVIGEGKSNVILKLNEFYSGKVIRLCKRFPHVSSNNEYLAKNKSFQSRFDKEFIGISNHIDKIIYTEVHKNTNYDLFLIIQEVLKERFIEVDEERILIMILRNYLDFPITEKIQIDYYTKIYNNLMVEFKPKWAKMNLYEYKKSIHYPNMDQNDKQIPFCRNCYHVVDAKPQVYCYNGCKNSGNIRLFTEFLTHLNKPNNILQKIYGVQKQLIETLTEDKDTDMFYINALIALRDISIFYNMQTEKEFIIDLDYKDITSLEVYHQKMQKEWDYLN